MPDQPPPLSTPRLPHKKPLRILIHSPAFPPKIGGLEHVTETIARELHQLGHEVTVLCQTPDPARQPFPYRVLRCPSVREALNSWRRADAALHMNISLKALPLQMLSRVPWVAAHHGWYSASDGPPGLAARLKLAAARFLTPANIAVSHAVAQHLSTPCVVIPNPYHATVFHRMADVPRERDFIFAGRLVSDKAPQLLFEAAAILRHKGLSPTLTVAGSGPEESELRALAERLNLTAQTHFTGPQSPADLARLFNQHRVLVVPSMVREGFGVVALEGIACGCRVIGSDGGGLPEAIGPCGMIFPRGDSRALAACMERALTPEEEPDAGDTAAAHLARHQPRQVALAYEEILLRAAKPRQQP